jgi:hypothetical protein
MKNLFPHPSRGAARSPRKQSVAGAASLPSIIAVGLLILVIGVSITAISMSESFVSVGSAQSATALSYAELGAKDALVRIARNKNYSGTYSLNMVASGCNAPYDGCAEVTVTSGTGNFAAANPKIVYATGTVKVSARKVRVDVYYDSGLYGEIATSTWQEITN